MTHRLTLGKLRGIQEIANDQNRLTITALDHRGSLRRALQPDDPASVEFERMVEFKMKLAAALIPHSSAILLDPIYGAAEAMKRGLIGGDDGLLVSLEATGYEEGEGGDRLSSIAEGWGVDKIKMMGASAVKLLLYYNPGSETASQQEDLLQRAAEDAAKYDIPLLVEPVTYSIPGGPKKGSAEFAKRKPEMVIETARRLVPLGIDVLKAEFPADPDFEADDVRMAEWCRELEDAAGVPWVLLSAGVDYGTFKRQVEIACASGASGFLAGRAIWQEVPGLPEDEQGDFLNTTSASRLEELTRIANEYGPAWNRKYAEAVAALDTDQGWQQRYLS
jgi:tagatose 1,6-diphosphate aldolase